MTDFDKRDSSWQGMKGHESARPYDPNATRAFNEKKKAQVQKLIDKHAAKGS